jgi:acetylornithine deacetylase/succinyl-diaminopimelate desuccinylase-like protein
MSYAAGRIRRSNDMEMRLMTATRAWGWVVALGVLSSGTAQAQQQAAELGARLMQDAAVKAAVQAAKDDEAQTIEDQVRLCEVPAPPFKETDRGKVYADDFRRLGLKNVRIDKTGNVLGERPGLAADPHLVFTAHLDTVFPEGTNVKVTREGTVLRGPGIGDDCRGLAVVLAVIRSLNKANVQTPGTITFVGTVGEEGLGDLRGVKALFGETLKGQIDRFVSVDGTGLGITHIGVGSLRYRVAFKGPGGHSYGAFGLANPVHALGRAIDKISDFQVPRDPKTTFNVGRIGGGTSVNSIAFEAWMEVDMRSADAAALKSVDANFHKAVDTALAEENERWSNNGRLSVDKQLVGNRAAGRTAADSPIVEAAVSVTKALGLPVSLDEGSTDSNVAMGLNIPAITIDGGGRGTGAHALGESFDTTNSWQGTQRATLLAIALAQK